LGFGRYESVAQSFSVGVKHFDVNRKTKLVTGAIVTLLWLGLAGLRADTNATWRAGLAAVRITPDKPVWMTGFGARTNESRGTLMELHAKALALEDAYGRRAVLVTADLLGFPAAVSDTIAREIGRRHGIRRQELIISGSHTHGAPALESPAHFMYGPRANPQQWEAVAEYTRGLEGKIVELVGEALRQVQPVRLAFAQGRAGFGVNRRVMTPQGIRSFVPNPDGPVDHSVPVLRVESVQGRLLGVVFGYGAHPTTILEPENYYRFSSDYPGIAQEMLEKENPGALALFIQGCGGDVMVSPRGTLELAQQYGQTLAKEVIRVMEGKLQVLSPEVRCLREEVALEFGAVPGRAHFEKQLKHSDLWHRWHAQEMLRIMDREGQLPASYPYPVQAWQLGELTLVALAGEVVAAYALNLKEKCGPGALWVAGYCNDLCAYIPSKQVVREGGYEGAGAMIYYMQPGPFAERVEEKILERTM
jgi:neutral ceramidase